MSQFLPMLSLLPLIGFWMWMFAEMARNPDLPPNSKYFWGLAFVLGNVFTAAYYWVTIYRNQP